MNPAATEEQPAEPSESADALADALAGAQSPRPGTETGPIAFDANSLLGPASQVLTIQVVRALFVVISASLGWDLARKVSQLPGWYHPNNLLGLFLGLGFGLATVVFEVKTSKQFAANIFTIVLGLFLGFIGSHLFFQGLLLIPHVTLLAQDSQDILKLFLTLVFCYLSIVALFQGKDQFKLIIPFVETEPVAGRYSPWLLDTSVIIDGRIEAVLEALKIEAPIVIPRFVLGELQALADSKDRLKRQRGRRGLDLLTSLRRSRRLKVEIDGARLPAGGDVDSALIELARTSGGRVVSNDAALRKVSQIQNIECISLNELADALKLLVLPGEQLTVHLLKPGEQPDQALAYLDDGTMVVVEHARSRIGESVSTVVTSVLQTNTGRMIFSKLRADGTGSRDGARGRS